MEIQAAHEEEAAGRRRVDKRALEAIGTSFEILKTERLRKVLWDKASGIDLFFNASLGRQ